MGDCIITDVPQNGWTESAQGEKLTIGEIVSQFATVNYKCSANSLIAGPSVNLCYRGNWTNPIQNCEFRCSARLISGISIVASSCLLNNAEVRCSDPAKPGTRARVYCRERYERRSGPELQITKCGDDGIWTPTPEGCTPICGEEVAAGTPFVIGGFRASINEVPWHVGIYKHIGTDFSLQCGGTIINERIIVSVFLEMKWLFSVILLMIQSMI